MHRCIEETSTGGRQAVQCKTAFIFSLHHSPPLLLLTSLHCTMVPLLTRMLLCYTQRRRDNFPGTQFFLDKLLILKKGLGQGIPKQFVDLK